MKNYTPCGTAHFVTELYDTFSENIQVSDFPVDRFREVKSYEKKSDKIISRSPWEPFQTEMGQKSVLTVPFSNDPSSNIGSASHLLFLFYFVDEVSAEELRNGVQSMHSGRTKAAHGLDDLNHRLLLVCFNLHDCVQVIAIISCRSGRHHDVIYASLPVGVLDFGT